MPYTLWSKGRLVGDTDLGFAESSPKVRTGWFHPTETGQAIVDVITAPSAVLLRAAQYDHKASLLANLEIVSQGVEALDLELRADDGAVVKAASIGISDIDATRQFASKVRTIDIVEDTEMAQLFAAEMMDELELMSFDTTATDDEEEHQPPPRYQIIVFMEGYDTLMDTEAEALRGANNQ